ncbi:aureocin A53 family class IId bacteriocin [Microbacterium sp.]|uniref:aureocin A53 family class IId bacteriocin n=1 Tax=Microbacterium sp. TaxID=51671 RepID=UPI003A87F180
MAFLRFVAWLARQIWKYRTVLARMVRWAWANRARVTRWLEIGITYGTIAGWIYNAVR